MEKKTKVNAENGKHDLQITREFDLPVELLFKAHVEPDLIEQWMTSKVVKLESKKQGSYTLEKKDDHGNIVFKADGVIHEFIPNKKIIRTFEMANTPFGVQLEVYEFEKLTNIAKKKCKIVMLTSSINPQDMNKSKKYDYVKKYVNKPLTQDSLKKLEVMS